MNIVADTNIFLAVALGQPERFRVIGLTKGHDLIAPSVLPFEIGNALSALARRKALSAEDAQSAWKTTQSIPVELREIDVRSALATALRHNIYAYDAYFLECAQATRAPILTLDKAMIRIAREMNVQILE